MAVSVLTQHNDNKRSGANLQETKLNTSNVNVNEFGLLASRDVAGQIYTQPLYAPDVSVGGTLRNLVIVGTMQNWVYAFDARDVSPAAGPIWKRQVHPHPVPTTFFHPNAPGLPYRDVLGTIGILSTPVIDPATHTLYLVAAAYEPTVLNGPNPQQAFKQLLFALDLATGAPKPPPAGSTNPVEIGWSAPGVGYHDATPGALNPGTVVDRSGGGAKVTVTVGGKTFVVTDASAGQVFFNPVEHMQRPGLLLDGGLLYIAFGSHGDFDPYHGWVFAYEAATLKQRGVFCASPGGAKAGIWQAGEGLVADGAGNIYCGTGNGDTKPNAVGGPDLGESFIRLRSGAASLDLNAFVDAFKDINMPPELRDEDLGAASPTILPDGFLVGGGKDGKFYLLDPAQLTIGGSNTAVVQQFMATRGPGSRAAMPKGTDHIHGSPVVYDSPNHGVLVYVWGENNVLRAYQYDPVAHTFPGQPNGPTAQGTATAHGSLFASNDIKTRDGMPGAMLSVSANGQTMGSAIVWASLPPFDNANMNTVVGELVAYDAAQFDAQGRLVLLWRSHQNPTDDVGSFPKFCCPTIADGKVFHATFSNKLRIYGLRNAPDGGYNLGFGGNTGLTLNGSARSNGGPIRLAGQHDLQAGSAFATQPVNVQRFTTSFRFQISGAPTKADGLTFCIQSEGRRALGGPGGGLGYGPDPSDPFDPGFKVTRSLALKFDLIDDALMTRSTMGLYRDGASPTAANAIVGEVPLDAQNINLQSGHHFRVDLNYDGTTLTAVVHDEDANVQITHAFPIDIPLITGNSANVGFTAGTGMLSANHDILSWQYTPL